MWRARTFDKFNWPLEGRQRPATARQTDANYLGPVSRAPGTRHWWRAPIGAEKQQQAEPARPTVEPVGPRAGRPPFGRASGAPEEEPSGRCWRARSQDAPTKLTKYVANMVTGASLVIYLTVCRPLNYTNVDAQTIWLAPLSCATAQQLGHWPAPKLLRATGSLLCNCQLAPRCSRLPVGRRRASRCRPGPAFA